MRLLDEQYMRTPFYRVRRMTAWLQTRGYEVNHKRVARLMRMMGLETIYPKSRLSTPGDNERIYPYLLRDLMIKRANHVWSTDIITCTHETVPEWERRFAPLMAEQLRIKRSGQAGQSWYVDETSIKVKGRSCYLYRAIDHDGHLVDSMLSEKRDMEASAVFQAGFRRCRPYPGTGDDGRPRLLPTSSA